MKKYLAEMIGTMVLVLMGCGSAVIAGSEIGFLGIAFAFGLSVLAMVYTIGGISGCHINPAITLGVLLAGRMSGKDAGMYMLFQVIGALIGSAILYVIASGMGLEGTGANMYGEGNVIPAFVAEFVFTFIFILVVLGSTSATAPAGFAGLAIGLALVLIHIVCIPVTGTSVNREKYRSGIIRGWQGFKPIVVVHSGSFPGCCLRCRGMEVFRMPKM